MIIKVIENKMVQRVSFVKIRDSIHSDKSFLTMSLLSIHSTNVIMGN